MVLAVNSFAASDHHPGLRVATTTDDVSIRVLQKEECPWFTYDAKDFNAASTDPNTELTTIGDSKYYYYDECDEYDNSDIDKLSTSFRNCFPQQHDYRYESNAFSCYSNFYDTYMGCCLGDGMYVVFHYHFRDLQISYSVEECGYGSKGVSAIVYPSLSDCLDNQEKGSAVCGYCNKTDSSASIVGWSFIGLIMLSLVIMHNNIIVW